MGFFCVDWVVWNSREINEMLDKREERRQARLWAQEKLAQNKEEQDVRKESS